MLWKVATVAAPLFVLAACDTTESSKREQLEQLERAKAEVDAIAQIDDAKCQSYGAVGSKGYVQCRSSLTNARREMNARGSGGSK
jgi:hypothetical protein